MILALYLGRKERRKGWGEIALPLSQNMVVNELTFRSQRPAMYFHAVCHEITVDLENGN